MSQLYTDTDKDGFRQYKMTDPELDLLIHISEMKDGVAKSKKVIEFWARIGEKYAVQISTITAEPELIDARLFKAKPKGN